MKPTDMESQLFKQLIIDQINIFEQFDIEEKHFNSTREISEIATESKKMIDEGLFPDHMSLRERFRNNQNVLACLMEISTLECQAIHEKNLQKYADDLKERYIQRKLHYDASGLVRELEKESPNSDLISKRVHAIESINRASVIDHSKVGPTLMHISDLRITPPKYLIDGMIEENTITTLVGPPGWYKSFIAVSMTCSISSGVPFLGKRIVNPGTTICFIGEGQQGIARRFAAWGIVNHVDLKSAPIFISSIPANLTDPESVQQVGQEIKRIAEYAGAPRLITFDTWQRNFGTADENSTADATTAVRALDYLKSLYDSAILILHHSPHNAERGRGSTVLDASKDIGFFLRKDERTKTVTMINTKSKDGPIMDSKILELRTVYLGIYDDDNQEATSAVITVSNKEIEHTPKNKGLTGKNQHIGMDLLNKYRSEFSGDSDSIRILESTWRTDCKNAGLDRHQYKRVKDSFIDGGFIRVDATSIVLNDPVG